MKKYNVSKPIKYVKDGVEKTYWANVGTMTEFSKKDGSTSRLLEIPAIGLEAQIFPIETKKDENTVKEELPSETDDINPEDIPF